MKKSEIQVRRKPRQSRAKITQEALLESFVRLLHQRSANKITIREITDLAGVGLGTFYEYFSKKEDLIALTIHMHVKNNAENLKFYAQSFMELSKDLDIGQYLKNIIHYQIQQIQTHQFLWGQIFLLERHISNIESYRKSYAMMLEMWQNILLPFVHDKKCIDQSLNLQRICYGFISQTLLIEPEFNQWDDLEKQMFKALNLP